MNERRKTGSAAEAKGERAGGGGEGGGGGEKFRTVEEESDASAARIKLQSHQSLPQCASYRFL